MFNNIYVIIVADIFLITALSIFVWRIRLKRIKKYISKYSGVVEIKQIYTGEKRMFINLCTQGIAITDKNIEKTYWYEFAKSTIDFCQNKKDPKILILGLGANTESLIINKQNPNIHQTIIEIDEAIIDACKKYFDLDTLTNYTLIHDDAYKVIQQKEYFNTFDVIIVDILTGEQNQLQYQSGTDNFVSQLRKLVKPNGMILFNSPAHVKKSRSHTIDFLAYLNTHFKNVSYHVITYPSGFNNYAIKIDLRDNVQDSKNK